MIALDGMRSLRSINALNIPVNTLYLRTPYHISLFECITMPYGLSHYNYDGTFTIRGCIQKFSGCPPGARTANGTAPCHKMQLYRYFGVSLTLYVASQRVFFVVYFVIDSVRKLLDTSSYMTILV
jgi:hypothetical protein